MGIPASIIFKKEGGWGGCCPCSLSSIIIFQNSYADSMTLAELKIGLACRVLTWSSWLPALGNADLAQSFVDTMAKGAKSKCSGDQVCTALIGVIMNEMPQLMEEDCSRLTTGCAIGNIVSDLETCGIVKLEGNKKLTPIPDDLKKPLPGKWMENTLQYLLLVLYIR